MEIWQILSYRKDNNEIDEVSEPFISAEYAMKDWLFNHLDWKHVEEPKFSGTVLEHWQAEDDIYDYILEKHHVAGSEDE